MKALARLILLLSLSAFSWASAGYAYAQDLTHAVIVLPSAVDEHERAAAELLRHEVELRTGIAWSILPGASGSLPPDSCRIVAGRQDQLPSQSEPLSHPEGFRIRSRRDCSITIAGVDDRGVLYGIGFLLRHLVWGAGTVRLARPLNRASWPQFAIRGHQLGYRMKNNTYDDWTPAQFEQYIADLAVFGSNTIEILPPITDDAPSSPLFHLPAAEMMVRISAILKKYGLRCSIFYPALARDYSDPATVQRELRAWGETFVRLPQLDDVFVPGGDPGHTDPVVLFSFLRQVAAVLHRSHPHAGLWVSSQGFDARQMQEFYSLLDRRPSWLRGVVVGPQSRDDILTQRSRIPQQYPIRFYPDIAHTMYAQFPVPEWDEAYALTEGREVIDPRPLAETAIFRKFAPAMSGFVTYSEGVNDDVNKFVWSALGWSADTEPAQALREYARYFLTGDAGSIPSAVLASGILRLERNWKGALLTNESVDATRKLFERMEANAAPRLLHSWRFQELLYRACTDDYERARLTAAQHRQRTAIERIRAANRAGSRAAMAEAAHILDGSSQEEALLQPLRTQIEDLAAELFRNIGLQLSVRKYHASAVDRGASLDTLDVALNDRVWLERQFARIRSLPDEAERQSALLAVADWAAPGQGAFYDDLGDPAAEPHLVRGPGYPSDPLLIDTALDGVSGRTPDQGWRLSGISWAGTLYDHPLELRYTGLSSHRRYRLRVLRAGENYNVPVRLIANDRYEIHPPLTRSRNPELLEFDLPAALTRSGSLDLKWSGLPGRGGGGRGLEIAEVWLLPASSTP